MNRIASITNKLDAVASEIEKLNPRIALAIDAVSDHLEGRKSFIMPEKIVSALSGTPPPVDPRILKNVEKEIKNKLKAIFTKKYVDDLKEGIDQIIKEKINRGILKGKEHYEIKINEKLKNIVEPYIDYEDVYGIYGEKETKAFHVMRDTINSFFDMDDLEDKYKKQGWKNVKINVSYSNFTFTIEWNFGGRK